MAAASALASGAAACGQRDATRLTPGERIEGRQVFVGAGCSAGHALADARSTSVTCPNLERVDPSFEHVRRFVSTGGIGMPAFKGKLTDDQIEKVARHVSSVSGY